MTEISKDEKKLHKCPWVIPAFILEKASAPSTLEILNIQNNVNVDICTSCEIYLHFHCYTHNHTKQHNLQSHIIIKQIEKTITSIEQDSQWMWNHCSKAKNPKNENQTNRKWVIGQTNTYNPKHIKRKQPETNNELETKDCVPLIISHSGKSWN